jgi:hypothetical protein
MIINPGKRKDEPVRKYQFMKKYGGVEVWLHSFLMFPLYT